MHRKFYKAFIASGCVINGTRYTGKANSDLEPNARAKRFTLYLQTCRNHHHGKDTTYLTKTFFRHVLPTKRSRQVTKAPVEAVPKANESSEDVQWNVQVKKAKNTVEDSRKKAKKTAEDTSEQIVIDDIIKILSKSQLRGPAKESAIMQLAQRIKVIVYVNYLFLFYYNECTHSLDVIMQLYKHIRSQLLGKSTVCNNSSQALLLA